MRHEPAQPCHGGLNDGGKVPTVAGQGPDLTRGRLPLPQRPAARVFVPLCCAQEAFFFAAQGLHGLQSFFFAAQGLHGLQAFFFAAQGLQAPQRPPALFLAAHGLYPF